jgi:hypothetical protein
MWPSVKERNSCSGCWKAVVLAGRKQRLEGGTTFMLRQSLRFCHLSIRTPTYAIVRTDEKWHAQENFLDADTQYKW